MRLQVTLAFICVLFPKALALKCYECIPNVSGQCTDTQKDCPDQCASLTNTVYIGGAKTTEFSVKTCAAARECVTSSLNMGLVKNTLNPKCCSTPLCNTQNPPALAKGSPNGKKCYACADNDCSGVVNCEGDEDQCISARGI
ncbi:hypothetical protein NFI96_018194 [Prochilodus magdalenae]|nr:hypothetical protein NFI96_018194 [Prochilodus magdalenae]